MTTPIPDVLLTTYLEMTQRADFIPAFLNEGSGLEVLHMPTPDLAYSKFLYEAVGSLWRWRDRLVMPEAELAALLTRSTVDVLYAGGVPAGYIELEAQGEDTEIAYFGLRPAFFGRGLGKHLLSRGIDRAWNEGARRVWVHTCNLDGPHALANYQKRGFRIYKTTEAPMPEQYV